MCPNRHIAQLRQRYVGRQVTVDASRPELARMAGRLGVVKAINCNGRAIVEFDCPDRSRYDIAPEFLRLVEPDVQTTDSSA